MTQYVKVALMGSGFAGKSTLIKLLTDKVKKLETNYTPTAGVDVELRHDLWNIVRSLRESGVTVILTTHYIEEAEQLADRVGVIRGGRIIVVEETAAIMRKLGKRQLAADSHSTIRARIVLVQDSAPATELTIGLIPEQNVFRQMERYEPLGSYIEKTTGIRIRFTRNPGALFTGRGR